MAATEQSTLIVLTTGKEAFVRANAVLQMTLMVRKTGSMPVELLLLGPGVEILRSNQKNSPHFEQVSYDRRSDAEPGRRCRTGSWQSCQSPTNTVSC